MLGTLASYLRQHHVAVLALFIALSGTAYAATLPRNSVGTAQLKKSAVTAPKLRKNAVTAAKIRSDAVTGAKVKDGSLTGSDLNVSTLPKVPAATTADSATKAATADSATNAATAQNATAAGVANRLATGDVNITTVPNPGGSLTPVEASCDSGFKGFAAGVEVEDPTHQSLVDLHPVDLDTWTGHVDNDGTGGNATLYIICGKVDSVTLPF
jgi:hypothetical protein